MWPFYVFPTSCFYGAANDWDIPRWVMIGLETKAYCIAI
jgi:hypothetical protein